MIIFFAHRSIFYAKRSETLLKSNVIPALARDYPFCRHCTSSVSSIIVSQSPIQEVGGPVPTTTIAGPTYGPVVPVGSARRRDQVPVDQIHACVSATAFLVLLLIFQPHR
jgi:hypothetical protein